MSRVLTEFEVYANAVQQAVERLRTAVADVDEIKLTLQAAQDERRDATTALSEARDALFEAFPELAPEPGPVTTVPSLKDWEPTPEPALDQSDTVPWVAPGGGLEFRKMGED